MTASLVSSGESKTAVNSNALLHNKGTKIKKRDAAVTDAVSIKVLKQHRIPHNEHVEKIFPNGRSILSQLWYRNAIFALSPFSSLAFWSAIL